MLFILIDTKFEAEVAHQIEAQNRLRFTQLYPYVFKWGSAASQLVAPYKLSTVDVHRIEIFKFNGQLVTRTEPPVPIDLCFRPLLFTASLALDLNDSTLDAADCLTVVNLLHDLLRVHKFFGA